ncbi:MAG: hemerythrin domain-containing protein [Aquaticitalea sp.]
MTQKPLKRHKTLQPLSRDHHHGLLLSWKIRSGFNKKIEVERIKTYTDWFFMTHLIPHFELEEQHIFPLLKKDNDLVKRALSEHRRLKRLFNEENEIEKSLSKIEEELEHHIRFEERVLFPEIQKIASEEELVLIEKMHQQDNFEDNLNDEFWR